MIWLRILKNIVMLLFLYNGTYLYNSIYNVLYRRYSTPRSLFLFCTKEEGAIFSFFIFGHQQNPPVMESVLKRSSPSEPGAGELRSALRTSELQGTVGLRFCFHVGSKNRNRS